MNTTLAYHQLSSVPQPAWAAMVMPVLPRRRSIGVWLIAVLLLINAPLRADSITLADAVKANYLFKFAPFVIWPAGVFASRVEPFSICLVNADSYGDELEQAVRDQTVQGHPVVIKRLSSLEGFEHCQVLYSGSVRWTPGFTASVKRLPILTVADDEAANAAIIQFVRIDGRVRFNIDVDAAGQSDLTLSSKLLSLAALVRGARQ
jgi:hypothetical protein